jgi:2-methylcitrate dehydratase PrpD
MGSITEDPATRHQADTHGTYTSKSKSSVEDTSNSKQIPPVTNIFAHFVASATPALLTPQLRSRIREYILDYIGITLAAVHSCDSTPSFLAAVKALGGELSSPTPSDLNPSTVVGVGKKYAPAYAALLNGALGHSLDFDDTYAPGTLHPGVTAISVALVEAERQFPSSTTDDLLIAIALGYELTCRLGRVLANDAYARGFHNTSTAGIFGAVATICYLRKLPQNVVENAFGLAGSKAAGSMQYLANGAWNKRLHPGFAAHDAFMCVALAESGVLGASSIVEGTMGFLNAYTPRKMSGDDWTWLAGELGERWVFVETSLKPFPACRMTHGFIEFAPQLGCRRATGPKVSSAADVKHITLSLSPNNVSVVGARIPNKLHPSNMVDAQFSAYFTTANSVLYGSEEGVQCFVSSRLQDPEIYALSEKITCVADERIKEFGSKIHIEYADGHVEEMDIPFPLGEVQRPFTREAAEAKFDGLATPVLGEDKVGKIKRCLEGMEGGGENVEQLLALVY